MKLCDNSFIRVGLIVFLICLFLSFVTESAAQIDKNSKGGSALPGSTRDKNAEEEPPTELEREIVRKMFLLERLTDEGGPIYMYAQRQEYRSDENLIIYSGNVVLRRDVLQIRAHRIVFNTWTQIGIIEGDVQMKLDRDFIAAERGEINLKSREIRLENCRGVIEPSLFFECEVLERLYPEPVKGRGRYYFRNAYFTPCNQITPQWSMKAREIYATADHYMHLFGSSFFLNKFPIFWFPYWFYPIKSNRSTGFLVPTFGYSSRDGWKIKNEFFWVLSDSADLTLSQGYIGKYRNEAKAEFRYVLGSEKDLSYGNISGRYVHEKWDIYANEEIPAEDRPDIYLLKVDQVQHFPGDINWRLWVDYQNNPRIKTLYSDSLIQQQQSFTNSWGGFSKSWNQMYLSLDANYIQSSLLTTNADYSLSHLPSFSVTIPKKRIGDSSWSYSLFSQVSHIALYDTYTIEIDDDTEEEQSFYFDVDRLHLTPSLRYTLPRKKTWYQIDADLEMWYTQWSDRREYFTEELQAEFPFGSYAQTFNRVYTRIEKPKEVEDTFWARTYRTGEGLVREAYKASVEFSGPVFYRIYDTSTVFTNISRIKHRIWTGVSYSYSPLLNQNDTINFDPAIDQFSSFEGITYYFRSDLLGRVYDKTFDQETVRSIASFSVQQSFDVRFDRIYNNQLSKYENWLTSIDEGSVVYRKKKRFRPDRELYPYSDIISRLDIRPSDNFRLLGTVTHDPYYGEIQRANIDLYLQGKKGFFRSGWGKDFGIFRLPNHLEGEEYDLDDIEYVYGATGGQISGHWGAALNTLFDYRRNRFHHVNLSLIYESQCWGLTLSFLGRQFTDQVLYLTPNDLIVSAKDEYNVTFMVHLKHVGGIGGYDYVRGGLGFSE